VDEISVFGFEGGVAAGAGAAEISFVESDAGVIESVLPSSTKMKTSLIALKSAAVRSVMSQLK
jgi:hypothetical protein